MYEAMGDPVFFRPLVSGACSHPQAQRQRLEMRHCLGDYIDPIGQTRDFDTHDLLYCRAFRVKSMKSLTASWLLGSTVKRSSAWSKCRSRGGKEGRMPLAFSTASGNFAGWAVASVTMALAGSLTRLAIA